MYIDLLLCLLFLLAEILAADDLLDEVKQYNVENGYRYTDDTQINILKQLDGKETRRRNAHLFQWKMMKMN